MIMKSKSIGGAGRRGAFAGKNGQLFTNLLEVYYDKRGDERNRGAVRLLWQRIKAKV